MSLLYSTEEMEFLNHYYFEKGAKYCAEKLNRSLKSVFTKANRLGLHEKVIYQTPINLSKLQSPQGAYLLGFLWADGHVSKSKNVIKCSIVLEDGIKIKNCFEYIGIWKTYIYDKSERRKQMSFEVTDKNFRDFLVSMDYLVKSAATPTKILNYLNIDLNHYFWRGYFDGDGCYSFTRGYIANFSGSFNQDWTELIKILNSLDIKYKYRQYNRNSGQSSRIDIWNKNNLCKWGDYIYQGEIFGLDRKYNKYQELLLYRFTRRIKTRGEDTAAHN